MAKKTFDPALYETSAYKCALERAKKPAQFAFRVRKAFYQNKRYTRWDHLMDQAFDDYCDLLLEEYTQARIDYAVQKMLED